MLLSIFESTLPFTNPVLKFFLILVIILLSPIMFNKIKVPALLGLIIAGAIIGPNGFNLMERDSGIILSGTAGLLYIMFLAGLEIDLAEFRKNSKKSIVFGLYTFTIPMILGLLTSLYILDFSLLTSILLASMFASHTLIAYPIISKLGVASNRAVQLAIGGTMITDVLALIVLAVIVGITKGEMNTIFWVKLSFSMALFGVVITYFFPIMTSWFFKKYADGTSQYIFVLVMLFFGALLAEIAGIEAIIGAFLSGLALNRLIPHQSALMNRVNFVGTAIFIPFFLIGVGMLVDFRVFFTDFEAIKVAVVMIVVATFAKFAAAWLTQKTFNLSINERRVIFGLSNAQAAATLAAVLIGYNIIIGVDSFGGPIRLLNESVLNGTILMILVTCTLATFSAQKGAKNLVLEEFQAPQFSKEIKTERILIPIRNTETIEELINLGISIKSRQSIDPLYALYIIDSNIADQNSEKLAKKLLSKATTIAAAAEQPINELIRFDQDVGNGISSIAKEHNISNLILGLHVKQDISDSFFGNITERILSKCNTTTLIYKATQPLATIGRHIVVMPPNAELEFGFSLWLTKIWDIGINSGANLVFYGTEATKTYVEKVDNRIFESSEFRLLANWEKWESITSELQADDNLILILSRKGKPSYNIAMESISLQLNKNIHGHSFILIFPIQSNKPEEFSVDFADGSMV
jgi:Kef-type K+ transport system membrane component KefB